jgi:hypothetical protein
MPRPRETFKIPFLFSLLNTYEAKSTRSSGEHLLGCGELCMYVDFVDGGFVLV